MNPTKDWTQDDFLCLMCLFGAKADMSVSEEEVEWLIKYFGEEIYQKTKALQEKQSDYATIQTLLELKKRLYSEGKSSKEIFDNLKCLFSADGEYSAMEKMFERSLRHLF